MQTMVGRVSQKGQVVIPASIRKELNLTKGSEVTFEIQDDKIMIKKLPSALDWADLIDQIPEEGVDFDENGHYDPKNSPEFHDWMVNG